MDSHDMSHIPSDEALEYLLAKTRAQFSEKVDDEAERLNQDLDALLYRVRGSRRASRSAALRAKAQTYIQHQREEAFEKARHSEGEHGLAHTPRSVGAECAGGDPSCESPSVKTASDTGRSIVASSDLRSLGVPDSYVGLRADTLSKVCSFIPSPPQPQRAKEGTIIAVVGSVDAVERTVAIAEHLALRTPGNAQVVLCGTKTLIPGQGVRARTSEELSQLVEDHPDMTYYAVFIDSSTHGRTIEKMIRENDIDHTWVVVDAMDSPEPIRTWLWNLPGHLSAQALAFYHVWDVAMPGQMLEQSVPIGLLDTAPASKEQWRLVFEAAMKHEQRPEK